MAWPSWTMMLIGLAGFGWLAYRRPTETGGRGAPRATNIARLPTLLGQEGRRRRCLLRLGKCQFLRHVRVAPFPAAIQN
jgi:hypothetical protein